MNGTNAVILKDGTEIVGQMEGTLTIGGTPIDMTNKSNNDFITLLDGELAGKQVVFAGSIVYTSDATFKAVRADANTGTQDSYSIVFEGSGTTTDESYAGTFVPHGMSHALPVGDKITTSLTFSSSGAYTYTAPV